jgi:alpha-D-ribose 1-methylphosphonate 5-triphosphate synthase subunit PhnG
MQDFAAMAQGAPAQEPQVDDKEGLEAAKNTYPTMEQMGKTGLPTGDSKEDIKARILEALTQMGFLEAFETPQEKQEFAVNLDALAEALFKKDMQAVQNNPLIQLYAQATQQLQQQQQQPQQQQQASPTDFASMMPGGGMGGR